VIFDTDVLIQYGKGHPGAAHEIDRAEIRYISTQTAMEFLQGSTSLAVQKERRAVLHEMAFEILPLTPNIGHRALVYIEEHALSGGLRSADALIAATAVENGFVLCTGNAKHFRSIKELKLKILKV
jgi:predicted nucleic acid-binding protein